MMEKYIASEIEISKRDFSKGWPGVKVKGSNKVSFYSWRFTKDERADLIEILSKFPDAKVKNFIDDLEKICIAERSFLKERNVIFQRSERRRISRHLLKAQEDLYFMVDKKSIPLQENKNLFNYTGISESMVLENNRLYYLMLAAADQLREIACLMEEEQNEPGRPSANTSTGEFVTVIAT